MTPQEQTNAINFLKELLPNEYYVVANGDHLEIHKVDVSPDDKVIKPLKEWVEDGSGY